MTDIRCFFALELKHQDKQVLSEWLSLQPLPFGRIIPTQNLHITLAFMGQIPKSKIKSLISTGDSIDLPEFSVNVNQWGYFEAAKTLWLGTSEDKDLQDARSEFSDSDINQTKGYAYIPHISVMRAVTTLPNFKLLTPPNFDIDLNHFCLYESISDAEGSRYELLERWRLNHR